jgi:hypothetical protein
MINKIISEWVQRAIAGTFEADACFESVYGVPLK